jgi:hypothetical protein
MSRGRWSIILRHRSRLYRRLLILRLRHLILRQRLSILHRLRRWRRRIRTGHRSRLLIDRLNLLYRLILVLDRRLRLLLQLLWWLRLRLQLPVGRLRLRHRRGEVLAVVVHADSGVLSERLINRD